MSRAYCCEICDEENPHWWIERQGDAVVTWACDTDLAEVCERLQRGHEVTRLSVQDSRKLRERAERDRAVQLDQSSLSVYTHGSAAADIKAAKAGGQCSG